MWIFTQDSGKLFWKGRFISIGYSGSGVGKNNPAMQNVHNVGPIPCGRYTIGPPHDTESHGPYVLPLFPHASNEMFGRDGFLIHGDSKTHPGVASQGCPILGRATRQYIWSSDDHDFLVVDSLEEEPKAA